VAPILWCLQMRACPVQATFNVYAEAQHEILFGQEASPVSRDTLLRFQNCCVLMEPVCFVLYCLMYSLYNMLVRHSATAKFACLSSVVGKIACEVLGNNPRGSRVTAKGSGVLNDQGNRIWYHGQGNRIWSRE